MPAQPECEAIINKVLLTWYRKEKEKEKKINSLGSADYFFEMT